MPKNAFYEHSLKQENYDQILIEKRPNGVAIATLNQPQKLNAIDPNMHLEVTSLARDLMHERPSEFDAQTGAVVRLARTHGVAIPVHQVLYALLLPIARNAS